MRKIKILYLGGKYFGKADASGICCKNLFKESTKQNITSYVLGYSSDLNYTQSENNREIGFFYKHNKKNSGLYQSLKRCIAPEIDNELVIRYFEYACNLIEQKDINVVVGIYFPIEVSVVLSKLKQKYREILVINYEVDSPTDTQYQTSKLSFFHNIAIIKYISNLYKSFDYIFILRSHTTHVKKKYKNYERKIIEIDAPFLVDKIKSKRKEKSTIDFLYTGFLDIDNYSPKPLLDLFKNNIDEVNWRLHLISRGNCEEILKKEAKNDYRIIPHGYVEYDKVIEYIGLSDFLLSIEYKQKPSSIPAKIFNYFSSGKPIIHFCSGNYKYFYQDYINKYNLGLCVINEKTTNKEIKDFIEKSKGKKVDYEDIISNFVLSTPKYSVDMIYNCYKGYTKKRENK